MTYVSTHVSTYLVDKPAAAVAAVAGGVDVHADLQIQKHKLKKDLQHVAAAAVVAAASNCVEETHLQDSLEEVEGEAAAAAAAVVAGDVVEEVPED